MLTPFDCRHRGAGLQHGQNRHNDTSHAQESADQRTYELDTASVCQVKDRSTPYNRTGPPSVPESVVLWSTQDRGLHSWSGSERHTVKGAVWTPAADGCHEGPRVRQIMGRRSDPAHGPCALEIFSAWSAHLQLSWMASSSVYVNDACAPLRFGVQLRLLGYVSVCGRDIRSAALHER